jgi:hypothetical protein
MPLESQRTSVRYGGSTMNTVLARSYAAITSKAGRHSKEAWSSLSAHGAIRAR